MRCSTHRAIATERFALQTAQGGACANWIFHRRQGCGTYSRNDGVAAVPHRALSRTLGTRGTLNTSSTQVRAAHQVEAVADKRAADEQAMLRRARLHRRLPCGMPISAECNMLRAAIPYTRVPAHCPFCAGARC